MAHSGVDTNVMCVLLVKARARFSKPSSGFLLVTEMAKDFSRAFYDSPAWRRTREAYTSSQGGLCELCRAKGLYVPGDTVHHKTHLTPDNINDPRITLAWSNLQLLCRDCHAAVHAKPTRRYTVDDAGNVIIMTDDDD